jgi:predicted amidohydrolase
VGKPDYASAITRSGEWTRLSLDVPAPLAAAQATIELLLLNAPLGTVWWDDISFEKIEAPRPRVVTVASVNLRPAGTGSPQETVRRYLDAADRAIKKKVDLIVFPEGVPVHGTGRSYIEVAETIPGPTMEAFAELARRKRAYVVLGMYEREGAAVYNTAALLDRAGGLAGKYRKVYVPHEELEAGLTPGNQFPVFTTDFGKVGIMICYDSYFPEPARALVLNGAELLVLPIWGGDETLVTARALENRVFVISSGIGYLTAIVDPAGKKIAEASSQGSAAIAEIDLNQRYVDFYLGDRRNRTPRELRFDVPAAPADLRH